MSDIDLAFADPRLAAIYDAENSGRDDIDFYLALAQECDAHAIVDLGCGTGVLPCDFASTERTVVGIDPANAMLDIARSRPGGDRVTWVLGDSAELGRPNADLIVMTGHVAQVFVDEDYWRTTLQRCFAALRPGGHLAFETRNPQRHPWTTWTRDRTTGTYQTADGTAFTSWVQVTDVSDNRVTFDAHNVFADTGQDIVSTSTLIFRDRAAIETAVTGAGFEVLAVYGDWDRGAASNDSPELIFVARRPVSP